MYKVPEGIQVFRGRSRTVFDGARKMRINRILCRRMTDSSLFCYFIVRHNRQRIVQQHMA